MATGGCGKGCVWRGVGVAKGGCGDRCLDVVEGSRLFECMASFQNRAKYKQNGTDGITQTDTLKA